MRRSLFLYASLLAVVAATPAFAQEAPETTAPETTELDEIVVVGQRAAQARAIDVKRAATALIDVAAADDIGNLPDRNVAEVIERLSGVGVQYDQGEGRYVAVRGIPSDLNNYTINGIEIGNPDGSTRRLPLDIVSGQLLNRVEVIKAKTADLDGQGIGGTVNLVTQTAFDFRGDRFLQLSAQGGWQELNDEYPVRGDLSLGGRFGADREFGVLLGVSYSLRDFASYGVYPDDWAIFPGSARGALPINIKYTDYGLERERIGAIASLDWRPAGPTELYVRALYSRFTEDEYRQRYRLDFATPAAIASGAFQLNPDGVTGTSTQTEIRQDLRLEYKEKSVLVGMAGGRTELGPWSFDYGVAVAHNEVIEPNQLWQFRASPGVVNFDFSERVFEARPRTPVTASMLGFRQYSFQDETGEEDSVNARIDGRYDFAAMNGGALTFGLKHRTTDKTFDSGNTVWTRAGNPNRFTLDQFGLAGPSVTTYPDGDDRPYVIDPTIDAGAILDFTADNLSGPLFVLDTATSLANATLNDTDVTEAVSAGYVSANLPFGDWMLTAGVRYERTDLDVTGFRLENETDVVAAEASRDYDDWLPSLIARWTPAEDWIVRLAYTRSLGRPNYLDLSPGGEIAYEDNGDGTFDGSVSTGNPELEPYRADGFDATAEWYFAPGGLVSFGVFHKSVDNPIYTETVDRQNVDFGGRTYRNISFSQRQNGDSASVTGVEMAWQQQFDFLPDFWSGFGLNANLTVVDSELTVPGRADDAAFPEQSDVLWGAQLFYQSDRLEASLAYHHTGRALIALGDDTLTDQSNDDLRRLDAKASFAVTDNISVFAEAQNLTDEPTRQYQGPVRDWIVQNERYGRVFNVGVTARW